MPGTVQIFIYSMFMVGDISPKEDWEVLGAISAAAVASLHFTPRQTTCCCSIKDDGLLSSEALTSAPTLVCVLLSAADADKD